MRHGWVTVWRKRWGIACTLLLATAGGGRAQEPAPDDKAPDLRTRILEQAKELEELQRRLDAAVTAKQQAAEPPPAKVEIEEAALRKIVADYLNENPGAGMPPGVQAGWYPGQGFVVRSSPAPRYVSWDDECKIPFELRIRGRAQLAYYGYKVTDNLNHQTGQRYSPSVGDFSQLEAKRVQLIFEGTAFTPDLRYHLRLHGDTRGLPGIQNNKDIQTGGTNTPAASFGAPGVGGTTSPLGGGILLDHAVRLFECWVAYDMHPLGLFKPAPDGPPVYTPTLTATVGKMKPFFGLEEYLGNQNEQFVEFSMADFMFDADDDNRLMAAGFMGKAFDDRFFMQAIVTNGSESLFANTQMDNLPGFIAGVWYDFGGSWDDQRKAWQLFGDCISDIDYSPCPVVRVGGCVNLVPLGRRSIYGDAEESRYFTMAGGPNGTRLINMLNGDGAGATPIGSHAVDEFDAYTYNTFIAAKYRGFSVLNEWWFRNLNNFQTTAAGGNNIIYQDTLGPGGAATNALFPRGGLFDYGMNLQAGYFIVPKRLEVAARWSMVRGESGDINGNGTFRTVTVPGVTGPVHVVNGAFQNYHEADEWTIGLNYFFKRHQWKWQTDVSWYRGGNPAGGAASIAGFIPGVDGYMLRSQIQLFF